MSTLENLGLSDIDALTLNVRDIQSRKLIIEAIVAYRGGALRSALVSTWIAVAYDIIAKARELASQGEAAPQKFVTKLENAIEANNTKVQREIEAELLTKANEDFQILAPHEYSALERLQRDRHLCAHPAFVLDDEPYQPSPELVRAHIIHALQYLLVHAPLQGKSAITRFEADLLSASFPITEDEIRSFLRTKYLDRAKEVLVKNLIKAIFSAPFSGEFIKYSSKIRIITIILREISEIKSEIYNSVMPSYVSDKVEKVNDSVLLNICPFIEVDLRIWDWLKNPEQTRIKRLLETASIQSLKESGALAALDIAPLSDVLLDRFDSFDYSAKMSIIVERPRKEFVGKGIEIYAHAESYRHAEDFGQSIILPLAKWYTTEDVAQVLKAARDNNQIWQAYGTSHILEQLFDQTILLLQHTRQYWERFVDEQTSQRFGNEGDHYSYPSLRTRLTQSSNSATC